MKKIIILFFVLLFVFLFYYFYKTSNETNKLQNYTIEQLQDLRNVDGIIEPVYTQDCFPRTLNQKGVTKDCFERANLGQKSFCTSSEITMIEDYYKNGQDNDPLNNGSGQFCADE